MTSPAVQLMALVDSYLKSMTATTVQDLINETLTHLEKYKQQTTLLKTTGSCNFESAFVSYETATRIVTTKIPLQDLKQRTQWKSLYEQLVSTLLNDPYIGQIKAHIKNKIPKAAEFAGGDIEPASLYQFIIKNDSVLIIDLRPREIFNKAHIKYQNVICIEPVSFKANWTDAEVESKSLLLSPDREVELFSKRDTFDLIVLCGDDDTVGKFAEIITQRGFDKTVKKVTKLRGGWKSWWCKYNEMCIGEIEVQEVVDSEMGKTFEAFIKSTAKKERSLSSSYTLPSIENKTALDPVGNPSLVAVASPPLPPTLPPALPSVLPLAPSKIPLPLNRTPPNIGQPSQPPITPIAAPVGAVGSVTGSPATNINLLPVRPVSDTPSAETSSSKVELNFTTGLVNLGNSCYMNCIIQCLSGTQPLAKIFLDGSFKKHINIDSRLGSKGVMATYFGRLVSLLYQNSGDKTTIQPATFKKCVGQVSSIFRNNDQQDCQEFLSFLLDALHEDLNENGGRKRLKELSPDEEDMREKLSVRVAATIEWERYLKTDFSVIVDLFQGQYASKLSCLVCGKTSTTYQPFSVLSLPVASKASSLADCFKEFIKLEHLEKDEYWNCPKCHKQQPSTKQMIITRLPNNLIIHLKRFNHDMSKNTALVNYPMDIDLTPFWPLSDQPLPDSLPARGQIPPFKYKLYGVANHMGTLQGGHYTATVFKGASKKWCLFDDTRWTPTTSVVSEKGYVLFYQRV